MSRTLDRARWALRRVQVFALVGKSGTGKSFRAGLIADKYGIGAIVDDGLLIAGGKIVAGHSAKRESQYLAAAKTACFVDPAHRRQVRDALIHIQFRRILLLGTSDRMILKNCESLGLPAPHKFIRIEDVATQEEIAAAIHDRSIHGRHVIPLPIIEVRRSYPKMIAESLTIWLHRGWNLMGARRSMEKTIVRPEFAKGEVTMSEAVLSQMVLHCIAEREPELKVSRIRVRHTGSGCMLKVVLAVPFDRELSASLHNLHHYIVTEVESFTGIRIAKLSLSVEEIGERPAKVEMI